jgi:restriction system protein
VRDFIGAIRTKRVEYGIFATTSNFTKDALDTAEKSANVKLIDGEELGRLLIQHNLGVTFQPMQIPRISDDYFSSL